VLRAAVLLAGLLLAGPAFAGENGETFKDWWVACDNVRSCTAYGFPPDEDRTLVLRVRRGAEAGAAPSLDIHIGPEDAKGLTGPLSLTVDGKAVARTGAPQGGDDDFREWRVTDAGGLLAAITRGELLELKTGGRTVGAVSLAGASAALRWMDDRQKRAGGVTALVAKGPASALALPAPPPLPVIRAAKPVSQGGLTDNPPPAVLARIKDLDCAANPPEGPTSSRLAPGVVLWAIPCWVGAYQTSAALVLADEKGGHARLADLGGSGDATDRAVATNANYDTDHQKLYSYAKGRGVADCGVSFGYVWTGKGFVMTERSELSPCRGLTEEFWVETYSSR
jgi:hypothetical protein